MVGFCSGLRKGGAIMIFARVLAATLITDYFCIFWRAMLTRCRNTWAPWRGQVLTQRECSSTTACRGSSTLEVTRARQASRSPANKEGFYLSCSIFRNLKESLIPASYNTPLNQWETMWKFILYVAAYSPRSNYFTCLFVDWGFTSWQYMWSYQD